MHITLHLSKDIYRMVSSRHYTAAKTSDHPGSPLEVVCSLGRLGGSFGQTPKWPATLVHMDWPDVEDLIEQFAAAGHPTAVEAFATLKREGAPRRSPFKVPPEDL